MTQDTLNEKRKRKARLTLLLFAVIFMFAILAPVIPPVAAGGHSGGHPQILGSISYVLTKGNFGFSYWNGGYYFGGPPVP